MMLLVLVLMGYDLDRIFSVFLRLSIIAISVLETQTLILGMCTRTAIFMHGDNSNMKLEGDNEGVDISNNNFGARRRSGNVGRE